MARLWSIIWVCTCNFALSIWISYNAAFMLQTRVNPGLYIWLYVKYILYSLIKYDVWFYKGCKCGCYVIINKWHSCVQSAYVQSSFTCDLGPTQRSTGLTILSPSNNASKSRRWLCYWKISLIVLVPQISVATFQQRRSDAFVTFDEGIAL